MDAKLPHYSLSFMACGLLMFIECVGCESLRQSNEIAQTRYHQRTDSALPPPHITIGEMDNGIRLGQVTPERSLSIEIECESDRRLLVQFEGGSSGEWHRDAQRFWFLDAVSLAVDVYDDRGVRLTGDAGILSSWTVSDGGENEPVFFYSMRALRLDLQKGRRYRITAGCMVNWQVQDKFPPLTVVLGAP